MNEEGRKEGKEGEKRRAGRKGRKEKDRRVERVEASTVELPVEKRNTSRRGKGLGKKI